MSDLVQFLLVVLLGVATGILSGMFGVGGAIISTPGIRALGATPLEAVGSTLPSVIPSSVSGTHRYAREGLVRWDVFAWTAGAGVVTAVGGALLTDVVPGDGHLLMLLTAVLMGFTAIRLARPTETVEITTTPNPSVGVVAPGHAPRWWQLLTIGIAAGGLSGLLGVGGGLVMVPGFVSWLKLPLKVAIATSLACVGALAVPGTVTHALLGHINWAYAIPLAIGVIPGAQIGAHLAISASERALRVIVACGLGAIAAVYFVTELVATINA